MVKFSYRHEDSPAALAPNWWLVLLVDALLALVVLAGGVVSILAWHAVVGWVLVGLATVYLLALVGRYRTWRLHRAAHGSAR